MVLCHACSKSGVKLFVCLSVASPLDAHPQLPVKLSHKPSKKKNVVDTYIHQEVLSFCTCFTMLDAVQLMWDILVFPFYSQWLGFAFWDYADPGSAPNRQTFYSVFILHFLTSTTPTLYIHTVVSEITEPQQTPSLPQHAGVLCLVWICLGKLGTFNTETKLAFPQCCTSLR